MSWWSSRLQCNDGLIVAIAISLSFLSLLFLSLSLPPEDFGNRPRKLHVVVNLYSGDSPGAVERTWTKVERLFQLAQIHMDITCE